MTNLRGCFLAKRQDWATPRSLFDTLDQEFHFTLDACASQANAKVPLFFPESVNSLTQDWTGTVWVNPPYGRVLDEWVRKAWRECGRGATVVMLLPVRSDTRWWHEYAMRADEIRFIRGRVRFDGAKTGAPFPSVVLVFRVDHQGPPVVGSIRA